MAAEVTHETPTEGTTDDATPGLGDADREVGAHEVRDGADSHDVGADVAEAVPAVEEGASGHRPAGPLANPDLRAAAEALRGRASALAAAGDTRKHVEWSRDLTVLANVLDAVGRDVERHAADLLNEDLRRVARERDALARERDALAGALTDTDAQLLDTANQLAMRARQMRSERDALAELGDALASLVEFDAERRGWPDALTRWRALRPAPASPDAASGGEAG